MTNLEKSQELENKIVALGGQITPEQEKQLLREMLEIRISELTTEGLSKTAAIEQACKEFEKDFQAEKTEKEKEQFKLLEETKTELLKAAAESPEESTEEAERKKKLAEEEKKKEEEEKEKEKEKEEEEKEADRLKKVSWIGGALYLVPQGSTNTSLLQSAMKNAPPGTTIFMHVNTHQVTFGFREGAPPAFGKNGNATTLDYDGLKLTGYDMGLHGEARLSISSDATEEQKQRFVEAAEKASAEIIKQKESGYNFLFNNCRTAQTTLGNAIDPNIKVCSMPPIANNQFNNAYEQQKEKQPAPADGTQTNAYGKTQEKEQSPSLSIAPPTPKPTGSATA